MAFDPPDDYQSHAKRSEREKQRLDLLDHGAESAGMETGRLARFFTGAASRLARVIKERKAEAERFWRTLAELMRDPAYVKRREEFQDRLNEARGWAARIETQLKDALSGANDKIDDMLDKAPRLPNGGPRVFRFADGRVIDEYGKDVSAEDAAGIVWPKDAPRAEEYLAALERRDGLKKTLEDLRGFEVDTLGRAQDRFEDKERGITIGEMDAFDAEFRDGILHIERSISAHAPDIVPPVTAPKADVTPIGEAPIGKPTL